MERARVIPKDVDVLVVGAGPAGLAAAICCASNGLTTRILTKARRQTGLSTPVQSLHPRTEKLLRQLDATAVLDGATKARFDAIRAVGVDQPFSRWAGVQLFGFHVDRDLFDELLLSHALAVGVCMDGFEAVSGVMEENGRISGVETRDGRKWQASWLIDATGYTRALASRLDTAPRSYSPPLTVTSGVIADESLGFDITRFEAHAEGWSWYTPAVRGQHTWTALQRRAGGQNREVAELIRRSMPGSVRLADASWRLTRPLARKGMLVAGDAAGRLDPAAGIGVANALESGMMAAQAIADSCAEPGLASVFHAEYDSWFVEHFEENAQQLRNFYLTHGIRLLADP